MTATVLLGCSEAFIRVQRWDFDPTRLVKEQSRTTQFQEKGMLLRKQIQRKKELAAETITGISRWTGRVTSSCVEGSNLRWVLGNSEVHTPGVVQFILS